MQEHCSWTGSLRGVVEKLEGSPSSSAIAAHGAAAAAQRIGKGAVNQAARCNGGGDGNGVALQ
jgi:hypothetical protein